jgi:hypothetical protein
MPRGGVSARPARRAVAPWWEELDDEAFRDFPTPRRPRIAQPTVSEARPGPRPGPADAGSRLPDPSRSGTRHAVAPAPHPRPTRNASPRVSADGSRPAKPAPGAAPRATNGHARRGGAQATNGHAAPAGAQATNGHASPTSARATAGAPATDGRRTVIIRGYGAERNLPMARPTLRRHERAGYRPDRTALWAVLLGMLLIFVAAASAHAAVLPHLVR